MLVDEALALCERSGGTRGRTEHGGTCVNTGSARRKAMCSGD